MQFRIEQEIVGNPGRLRARSLHAMSRRMADALEAELAAIRGLTVESVNPRSGGVLVFYSTKAARAAAYRFFACEMPAAAAGPLRRRRTAVAEEKTRFNLLPLFNYFCVRPFLPVPVRLAMTAWRAVPYICKGLKNLAALKCRVELLDGAAIAVSLLRRDYATASMSMMLLGVGEMLEAWTRQQSLASLEESLALRVNSVWVLRDGTEVQVPIQKVRAGDVVVVRAGGAIPVDGIVASGEAMVNQASMTGEPLPVHRTEGAAVFAGTVVEEGSLNITVSHVGAETRLQQVVSFINESEAAKAGVQGRYERMADMAVPVTFLIAGLVWAVTRNPLRASSVLLVDYSCALKLTTPLTVLSAMREAAVRGVLVKGGRYLEAMNEADTVLFDKTGTLTQAQPRVVDVVPAAGWHRDDVLRLSACLEEHFPHPVARAVVHAAECEKLEHAEEHAEVQYVVAHGIASLWHGKKVVIGSRHYVEYDEGVELAEFAAAVEKQSAQGRSLLYLAVDGSLAGIIAIEDPVREESAAVIAGLRARGIRNIVMLTGDDKRTAAAVAGRLGIDEYRAQVLPADKSDIVQEYQAMGHRVIMIGDGINDSPALSAADIGVSLSDGADLAQEVANVVLLDSRLESLLMLRDLSRAAMRKINSNFALTMGLNTAFMAGGLAGILSPGLSALMHNASTVGLSIRSMRPLLRPEYEVQTGDCR